MQVVLCKPNKLYTFGNVMSLAKMLFSHHFNNMPIVGFVMSWSYSEQTHIFSATALHTETVILGLIAFQSACAFVEVYNGKVYNAFTWYILLP